MLIGTQYLRPPNPDPEHWEGDLRNIQTLGFSLVRCWLLWRSVEPKEGHWQWDPYDRFMELAERHGLSVVIQLIPEAQPQWFLRKHRDLLPVTATGERMGQAGYGMLVSGGYPGIYFDHDAALQGTAEFFTQAARRYGQHPATHSWDVWNEIQPHDGLPSYDAATLARWHGWLRERYRSIEAFNQRLLTQYERFEEIEMPRKQVSHDGCQQMRRLFDEFRYWRQRQEMKRRAGLIRAVDRAHPVHSHVPASGMNVTQSHMWQLAAELDGFGTSQYLNERVLPDGYDYRYAALYCATARSAANGKPWWMSEQSGGPTYYQYGHNNRTPAEIRSNLLLPMSQGAEVCLYWQYRGERFGEEAPNWALTNFDGSLNERTAAAAQVAEAIQREKKNLANARRPTAEIGVLVDHTSRLYELHTQSWVPQGVSVAAEAEDTYVSLGRAGFAADFHHAENVAEQGLPPACRLLFLPMCSALSDAAIARLLEWVAAGGTLVAGAYLGMYDEDGYVPPVMPREPWSSALGLRVLTRHYPTGPVLEPNVDACPPLAGHWTVEELRVDDAEVLATWQSKPALTRRGWGQGQLYYAATCIAQGKHQALLRPWLERWAEQAGVVRWHSSAGAVLADRLVGPRAQHLFFTACTHADQTATLLGSADLQGPMHDAMTGRPLGTLQPGGEYQIEIAPRETRWVVVSTGAEG